MKPTNNILIQEKFTICDSCFSFIAKHTYKGIKFQLLSLFLFLTVLGKAQNDTISNPLNRQRLLPNCETISLNAVDLIAVDIKTSNYQEIENTLKSWTTTCGSSEISKRIAIIKAIINHESTKSLIKEYIDNNYQYHFKSRLRSAKEINFGYIYTNNMYYFDYVPLRHAIDSILSKKAFELIQNTSLNQDEKLLCLLFSGEIDTYEKELEKSNLESLIKTKERRNRKQNIKRYLGYYGGIYIYSGMYMPLREKKVFSNDLMFGFGFRVTGFDNKYLLEISGRVRVNNNDKDFNYFAFDEVNTVNAETSTYFGGFVGYKILDIDKLIVYPKIGIGVDSVDTGLVKKNKHTDDEYFDVEVIHLSTGISLMTPIFNATYMGVELSYHYTPYQLDKNLQTEFNTSAFSAELFVRF